PHAVAEPERRSSEQSVDEERPHERVAARGARASAGGKRKLVAVGATTRAGAAPPRHSSGSTLAPSREPERRVSTTRRSEGHGGPRQGGKAGPVHVLDQPTRRTGEQRRHERPHRAADT